VLSKNRPAQYYRFYPLQTATNTMDEAAKKQIISDAIRTIPDFPKAGIQFQDVTTILLDPKAFQYSIDLFTERYKDMNIDVVAGMDSVVCL
jgi:adenine phosphoribosyltransferase